MVENVLTMCLKVICGTFGSVLHTHFPGYIQVEAGSIPCARYMYRYTHANKIYWLTWTVLFLTVLCTLSCAMSYWHFSGTLLHLFYFIFHCCIPLYSKIKHLLSL